MGIILPTGTRLTMTRKIPARVSPEITGNTVRMRTPFRSTAFLSAQTNRKVQPNIREAAMPMAYLYSFSGLKSRYAKDKPTQPRRQHRNYIKGISYGTHPIAYP
jgi:hypothetical protein